VNVAVLGGGIMGNGIAQIAATVGDDAVVRDLDEAALERARSAIETSLGRFVKKDRLTADEAGAVLGRIRFTTDMETALRGADVVIEAVPEVLDLKRSVWRRARARACTARDQHVAAVDHVHRRRPWPTGSAPRRDPLLQPAGDDAPVRGHRRHRDAARGGRAGL
jgi:glycerol-3-phosphate dehydrogenase